MLCLREEAPVTLTALQKKMLPAIEALPLPEDCPTALRYALAKYDADAVAEAWDTLRELAEAGHIVQA